jgi:mannose-6-phosphate isomerase-like protein (cupin superfamily)
MTNKKDARVGKDALKNKGWAVRDKSAGPRKPVKGKPSPGVGVLYRVSEVTDRYSTCEVELPPDAEGLVEMQDDSEISYERIVKKNVDGSVVTGTVPPDVVVLIDDDGTILTPPGGQKKVPVHKKWKHFLKNPTKDTVKLRQTYEPAWNSGTTKYEIAGKLVPSHRIWFELKESEAQTEKGLKYRIKKFKRKDFADVDVRIDPGVKSITEYHKVSKQVYTVTKGTGTVVIDGKLTHVTKGDDIVVNPGQKFQFDNDSGNVWELKLDSRPEWTPDDSFYEVSGKVIPGNDMWFGVQRA